MKTQAIVVAGGSGRRLKAAVPKPLILLQGKPLIVFSLEIFETAPCIDSVILVGCRENFSQFNEIVAQYHLTKVHRIVAGGNTRRDSVANGLKSLADDTQLVVVHDAARPFLSRGLVEECYRTAIDAQAVIAALPMKSTVKRVNPTSMSVEATLDRGKLWEAQTPQIFKRDIILKAHREVQLPDPSDDALLVEQLGVEVKVVLGDERNIKITTPQDVHLAEAILNMRGEN